MAALRLLAAVAFIALAGCSALEPQSGSSEPPGGISLRVGAGGLAAADARARDYCARYGGTASRNGVHRAPAGDTSIAVYTCHH